jgi:tripartite motif-containing protein 2/3
VKTVDYHGKPRTTGGDPITVQLHKKEATESIPVPVTVEDRDDGTYVIKFRPKSIGW